MTDILYLYIFTWNFVSYKLCFAALFMLTIQITIFTVRSLAEKLKNSALCPNNLFLSHYFHNKRCYFVSDFNRWVFVIERQCDFCEPGN